MVGGVAAQPFSSAPCCARGLPRDFGKDAVGGQIQTASALPRERQNGLSFLCLSSTDREEIKMPLE